MHTYVNELNIYSIVNNNFMANSVSALAKKYSQPMELGRNYKSQKAGYFFSYPQSQSQTSLKICSTLSYIRRAWIVYSSHLDLISIFS